MGNLKKRMLIFFLSMLFAVNLTAGEHKFSGILFGDAYWFIGNHSTDLEGQNGFWIRRVRFTYNNKMNDQFSSRFRLEANSPGKLDGSTTTIEPIVKDAYLKWKIDHGQQVIIGLQATPLFDHLQKIWGYRFLEKTAPDLFKLSSSRDIGVALKGKYPDLTQLSYHLMIANGNGNRSENNEGKKYALAVNLNTTEELGFQVAGSWEDLPGKENRYTYQLFGYYQTEYFRFGLHATEQHLQQEVGDDIKLRVGSGFVNAQINEKLWGVLRVDRLFDANTASISYIPFAKNAKATFVLLGLDILADKHIHFSPNVEMVFYDVDSGATPESDVIPRVTFSWKWK